METNKSTGGRPRDTSADPHLLPVEDEEGNVIAKTCRYCSHRFSIQTSVNRIKAHLCGVSGHGVAPCKLVPSDVKKLLKMPCQAQGEIQDLKVNIPSKSGMQQPLPQECCTSDHPSPQIMSSVPEQCPIVLDGCFQQSNVDSTCLDEHPQEMETLIPEGLESQEDILALSASFDFEPEPEPLNTEQPHKNDEAYLGMVDGQSAASCEKVLSNVEEAARNALPSSSSNLRSDAIPLLSPPITNIPSHSDLQQPPPQECCTSGPPSPQNILDGSLQQTIVDSTCSHVQLILLEMETLDGFESQENVRSYHADLCSMLEPVDTQQRCMNDETNLIQGTLTTQDILSMGSDCLHLQQPVLESLQADPPPSSEPKFHDMDIDPSPAPSDTGPTASDQAKHEKKRKLLEKSPPIGKKLLMATKFQGQTFNEMVDEIYESLEDNSVSRIGVCGIGGSGKIKIMKHIHNILLDDYFLPFGLVIWVTVSVDHMISELQ